MISTEKLKKFILDTDSNVRREAGSYFYEGHIQDLQILPLTLQACQKYGFSECTPLLFYTSHQLADDFTAAKVLDIMLETEDENTQIMLSYILSNASISFLEKNIEVMQTRGIEQQWTMANNRLSFSKLSAQQLWKELNEYAENCRSQDTDVSYTKPLIDLLAKYDYPDTDHICELLEEDRVQGHWMEIFLIKLAAARKIEQAIPIINSRLAEVDLFLSDSCSKALSEIGTETVVELLKEGCKNGSWDYQMSASHILGRIKLAQSELAIIELLENHSNTLPHDIYCNLCFSLCDLFSNKAFHYGEALIDDIEAIEIDSMRERLITLSRVLDIPLSQKKREKWEKEIALESQRRREHRQEKHPELYRLGNLLRNHFGENDEFYQSNILDQSIDYDMDEENIYTKPANTKIGRNEPCPCGSGKKYKKCCGKRSDDEELRKKLTIPH